MSHPLMNKLVPFLVAIVVVFFGIRVGLIVIKLLAPFIVAFIIATIAQPLKAFLKKHKFPNILATAISLISLLFVLYLLFTFVFKLISSLSSLISESFSDFGDNLMITLEGAYNNLAKVFPDLQNYNFAEFLDKNFSEITKSLSAGSLRFASVLLDIVKGLPSKGFFAIITIVASFYSSYSYEEILAFGRKHFKRIPYFEKIFHSAKSSTFKGLGTWLKAQGILLVIIGTICSIAFGIFGYRSFVYFGFLVGILDALPVFGLGAIVLPLMIYHFIVGNVILGFAHLALYALCIFVRQSIEPRIIGKSIGINPLFTLIAVFVGFRLGGLLGILLAVIAMIAIVNILNERGYL